MSYKRNSSKWKGEIQGTMIKDNDSLKRYALEHDFLVVS